MVHLKDFALLICINSVLCEIQLSVISQPEVNEFEIEDDNTEEENAVPKIPLKTVYENLKKTVASVKKSCGEICDQTISGKPGKYFDEIHKKVDCDALFSNPDIDDPSQFHDPPSRIPKWLKDEYSYSGKIPIDYNYYYDDSKGQHHYSHWNQTIIDIITNQFDTDTFQGPYGKKYADMLDDFMKNHIDLKDKQVIVIGSHTPWIEMMAVKNGAKKVLSVDYNEINSDHPQIDTMHALELNKRYLDRTLPQFDVLISYSSLEHSGLGRYGDNLNPWGDVIAMARGWCLLKPGGRALIGVPTNEQDKIYFNINRQYGPIQYPHLFANWKQIHSNIDYEHGNEVAKTCLYCYQPLVVAEKPQ